MSSERARIERAKEILDEQPADFPLRDYFEAMANESLPQYYSDILNIFHMYSDDLPPRTLVGFWHPKYPMMKCRGNVIVGIGGTIQMAVNDGVIKSSEVIAKVKLYKTHEWNYAKGKKGEYWTTPEEIVLINNTLDAVGEYLKGEYGLKDNGDFLKARFQETLTEARKHYNV